MSETTEKDALDLLEERQDTAGAPDPGALDLDELSFPAQVEEIAGSELEDLAEEEGAKAQLSGMDSRGSKPAYMESLEEWEDGEDPEYLPDSPAL